MYDNFNEEVVTLENKYEYAALEKFLLKSNLTFEKCTHAVRITNHKGDIVGTGSVDLNNQIIKGVAVDPYYRETVVFSKIITHLLEYLSSKDIHHCFVFTKPSSVQSFKNLQFREIERAEPLIAVLEYGVGGIQDYKNYLQENKQKLEKTKSEAGSVVVNCNPFTLGHRYLIETAAKKCDELYVFVVEEDLSIFPFDVRFDLIEKGTEDLKNVKVLKGGKYIISSSTFPSYFLKNETETDIAKAQAELDVRIFANQLAPVLNIKKRFVGTEDYCVTTANYNEAMKKVLPGAGIDLEVIERMRLQDDLIISASHVRKAIKEDNLKLVKKLVPESTYKFLQGDVAREIIEKLKSSDSRH
jgi:[citrate (pro-3S)-lyase] ligase